MGFRLVPKLKKHWQRVSSIVCISFSRRSLVALPVALQYPLCSMLYKVSYTKMKIQGTAEDRVEWRDFTPSATKSLKLSLTIVKHDNSSSSSKACANIHRSTNSTVVTPHPTTARCHQSTVLQASLDIVCPSQCPPIQSQFHVLHTQLQEKCNFCH